MRHPTTLRQLRRIVAGGVLAGLALGGLRALSAGRLRSPDASREDDEQFRLLAEKTNDLVCLHEPDGRYLYINPSCRRLLGYDREDLLGTDPYELFHPEDLERIRSEAHDKALEGQGAVSVTYRIRKASGDYTWFKTLTEPILDERGEVVRLQTAPRDVSERKRAEEALAEAAQAILALVDNAVKYGPEGQRVTLGSASAEGELRVVVGDRGPGIPETELPHIFERFYRLAEVEEPGSGLGLSIAQTMAEAHDGRIEAESQPGEGTRMSFVLPLLQVGSKVC